MPSANNHTFQIAIDGPAAAGKGTTARLLAKEMKFLYVDTGAMYRAAALLSQRHHLVPTPENEVLLAEIIANCLLNMYEDEEGNLKVILNSEDISDIIRTPEISKLVSKVATLPKVREVLVEKQQQIAREQPVVMEGRDITYRVLPDADLKVYLTADDEVRATRRLEELELRGEKDLTYEKVLQDLRERDLLDSTRATDPLKIVEGAMVVDTTNLTIEEVVQLLATEVARRRH